MLIIFACIFMRNIDVRFLFSGRFCAKLALNVWYNSPLKPSGPEVSYVEMFFIKNLTYLKYIGLSWYLFLLEWASVIYVFQEICLFHVSYQSNIIKLFIIFLIIHLISFDEYF